VTPQEKAREALAALGVVDATDAQVLTCIALSAHARIDNLAALTTDDPWALAAAQTLKESK
jgi:hypothetical protein